MENQIFAGMATMPSRLESLEETINSIINQVDKLYVYLNEFSHKPGFLNHPKIFSIHSENAFGDLGDAGKFYCAGLNDGYFFTIDDDIIYPVDYVGKTIESIEKNDRKYIITYHGRKYLHKPVKSFYNDADIKISYCKSYNRNIQIDIPGTGVMAYHTDTFKCSIEDFKTVNMADVWVGKKAKEEKVNILCMSHNARWIRPSRKTNKMNSIYNNLCMKDSLHTEILNSHILI